MTVLQDAVRVFERAESSAFVDNDLGLALNNLGNLLLKMDRDEEAIVVFEKASRVITRRFGESQPLLVKIWGLLAQEYLEVGNLPMAKKYAELAAALSDQLKWPKGKSIVFSVLADIHLIENHADLAIALLQEVADWKDKTLSPQHPNFISTWLPFGYALRRAGQYEKALGYHERALLLATNGSLWESKALAEVEVALDHIALGQWVRVPELAAACLNSDKKKLLHADESLSCKLVNAELAQHQGNGKLGSKLLREIVQSKNPGCKGIRTWLCGEVKETARARLDAPKK